MLNKYIVLYCIIRRYTSPNGNFEYNYLLINTSSTCVSGLAGSIKTNELNPHCFRNWEKNGKSISPGELTGSNIVLKMINRISENRLNEEGN